MGGSSELRVESYKKSGLNILTVRDRRADGEEAKIGKTKAEARFFVERKALSSE